VILNLPPSVRLYVATEPVDMRKSFDGLSALVEHHLEQDPLLCVELQYVAPLDNAFGLSGSRLL